ncbi:MAG: GH3 auxin-responsive promoter family protein [Clostridia bacterium]|nr:GH3 auxin-responsive promoter family protein [Clostridia bacterium]
MAFKPHRYVFAAFGAMLGIAEHIKLYLYSKDATAMQKRLLLRLMRDNRTTEYGKKNGFKDVKSVADYQRIVPLSDYLDYEEYVHRMADGEKGLITNRFVRRFTESSGSTGRSKLVPLSGHAEWNCQCFSFSAPVGCAVKYFAKEKHRPLPPQRGLLTAEISARKLKGGATVSCLSSIPLLNLKPIVPFITSSPKEVLFPAQQEDTDMHYVKLRFALQEDDISYLGTIFITTLESMFFYMEENWELLCRDIEKGTIDESIRMSAQLRKKLTKRLRPRPERAEELRKEFRKGFDTEPIIPRIWPACGWLYGMGTGALSHYAKKLRRYIGEEMPIHYLGYAATEALMAVPIELDSFEYVLLPHNAFYEFLPLDAPEGSRPLTISEVQPGEEYELILTNLSGFYRYRIEDVVRVTGFYHQSPKVTFCYRLNQIANISGEKVNQMAFDEIVGHFSEKMNELFIGYSIYADRSTSPGHYVLLLETANEHSVADEEEYARIFERTFCDGNVSVEPLINSGALGHCEVHFLTKGTYDAYRELLRQNGANLNQVKPIKVITTDMQKDFFFNRIIR